MKQNQSENAEVRVLVADDEMVVAERLVDFLSNNGFYTRFVRDVVEAKNMLLNWRPDFILLDLMLSEGKAVSFLKDMQQKGLLGEDKIRVIMLSGHNHEANVKECMKWGANDFIVKPFKYVDVLSRLVLHKQKKRILEETVERSETPNLNQDAKYYMNLTELTLREALKVGVDPKETLYNLSRMVAMATKAVRVSIVHCNYYDREGQVWASSDKKVMGELKLDLSKYPEVLYVVHNSKLLALDNLDIDPTMSFVTKQNKSIKFNSLIVCPILLNREVWGVVSVRLPETRTEKLSDFEIRFVQIVANVMGTVLLRESAGTSALRHII